MVWGVALFALTTACSQEQKPGAKTTASTTTSSDGATTAAVPEIVYVNSDSLLANYEYFKEARTRLQGKSQKAEQDLRAKAEAFQKEVNRYQQSAQGMSAEQRASTEQRLGQKQQQLAALNQNAGNDIAAEESEEMKKIYDKVEDHLKAVSAEKGYKMVLTYSRGNSAILYSDASLDITEEVLTGLNEKYTADKAATPKATTEKKK
ncbi:OmpH family outer membrane protein [Pontibacter arcticus]|uniref:OmpH family outer membrane protein n=1 Tax=Pontibacter arcticus TaxID=2080288 RepID=A0A364RGT8_9BACT|nr:OmpH family outer membrane protein [Pontibacter arcticus]